MNLESMPAIEFAVQEDGYLPPEWQNFFSINNQNFKLFFSNVGHLVPSRTNADISVLSNAGMTDPTLYVARSLYNNDTSNFMGNVSGTYLNYTMHTFLTRSKLLSMTYPKHTIRYFGDESNNLYVNVNGHATQIPRLTKESTHTLNFHVDESGLHAVINGRHHRLTLEAE